MKRVLKIVIILVAVIIAVFGLAIISAEHVLNSSAVKSQIENSVGQALDLNFQIEGRINLRFLPSLSVATNKVSVSAPQGQIAFADRIEIYPRIPDLMLSQIYLDQVHIQSPQLTFDPLALDKIRSLADAKSDEPLPLESLVVDSFSISKGKFFYSDNQFVLDFNQMNFDGDQIAIIKSRKFINDDVVSFFQSVDFKGEISAKQIIWPDFKLEKIRAKVENKKGSLTFDPVELDYFGARTKIAGVFDMKDNLNHLKVRIEMPEVDLEKSFRGSGNTDLLQGMIDFKAEFEAQVASIDGILKNAQGEFSINGQNLTLKSVDLDKALDEFKKISGYGFNDFSALLLLGPLGPIVSHGYDQLDALEKMMKATGDSKIQHVVSDWKVANSVFVAADVAFSTQRNRVAVKGGFDLSNKKFNSMTIAVVDPNGCIVNSETVDGTFENPEIKDVGVIERTVVRPLKRFFKTKCDFFYDGTVPHPTGQR